MKKQLLLVSLLLLGLTLAAHAPALRAGFVWDDTALVLRDPLIRSWRLIPEGFQHYLFTDATPSNFYRPLQRCTYLLEYWAGMFQPANFHLTNILLHAGAAIALFAFALAFLEWCGIEPRRRLLVSAMAAAVWVLHPLHSAVVDYVSGRADSLAALFGFTGLILCVRAAQASGQTGWKYHAFAAFAFLASALSRESGLLFPLMALALLLARGRHYAWRGLLISIAFVLTIYGTLRLQAGEAEIPRLSSPASLIVRPLLAARASAEYAGLLFAPVRLHLDRDVETRPEGTSEARMRAAALRELEGVAGFAVLLLLGWWVLRSRQRERATFAFLLCAGISYAPVCGLLPLNATIAEHWIYVPSAFLLLALALQIAKLQSAGLRDGIIIASCVWMVALGARSFVRASDWKDQRTFLERTIAAGGDSARMLINLGVLEMEENRFDSAAALFRKALQKEPKQPFALLDLAVIDLKKKDFTGARKQLDEILSNPATEAQAREMLAVLEYKEHAQVDLRRLRLAARSSPPSWTIERRYVRTLWDTGCTAAAVAELKAILRTEYYRAESWQLLALYLARTGQRDEARAAFAQASAFDVHLGRYQPL